MSAPPLTDVELQKLKKQLLKKGAEINEKLVAILNGKDPGNLDAIFNAKPGETKEERLRRFLALVDSRIQQIRAGTYGKCVQCGDWLPFSALEQIPWIDTCSKHAPEP